MTKWTVIVVHGVGNAAPGSILADSSKGMPGIAGERSDLVLNGCTFPTLDVANHPSIRRLIEVNWSDVASPTPTPPVLADYGVRIVAALLRVATQLPMGWWGWVGKAYRFVFEALLVFCLYPALVAMLLFVTPSKPGRWVIAIAAPVAVAVATGYLKRFGRALWAGLGWALLMLAGNVAVMTGSLEPHRLVELTTRAYVWSQELAGGLLVLTLLVIACRFRTAADRGIAAAALFCFPLFIVSAIGALLWALAFAAVRSLSSSPKKLDAWQGLYAGILDSLRYDLRQVEWGFAGLIGVVGVLLLLVARRCWTRTGSPGSEPTAANRDAGARARNGVVRALLVGAVGYVVLVAVLSFLALMKWHCGSNASVIEIYVLSALRVVPYLALITGPLSLVTGIIVDVLFYVADMKPIWTAPTLRERFGDALAFATTNCKPVAVVAHSQGSVIAVDVVGQARLEGRPVYVFTAGLPIESLYARFLGSTLATRAATFKTVETPKPFERPSPWLNFSRSADYIGANQAPGDTTEEIPLDGGTHTGYWELKDMWSWIGSKLSNPGRDEAYP